MPMEVKQLVGPVLVVGSDQKRYLGSVMLLLVPEEEIKGFLGWKTDEEATEYNPSMDRGHCCACSDCRSKNLDVLEGTGPEKISYGCRDCGCVFDILIQGPYCRTDE